MNLFQSKTNYSHEISWQDQKSSLVSGNQPSERFFYHLPTRIVVCVSEYIVFV